MDRAEIDQLVRRLVEDPHDEEALHYAHQAGESDPKSYAMLLERVGTETRDPVYASHWLSEAANVWTSTLSDQHRAARLLMMAIDKDPTQQVAADRLAQLYRDKGDTKALVALLDRRAKALAPLAASQPEIRGELAGMYEELGRLWNDPPLSQPKKALDCFRRAMDLDPTSAYSIFNVRELLKTQGQLREALPLYDAEIAIEEDVGRKIGLYRDQSDT
jgi:tetratricopeptide (TPR) repeat protein